MRILTPGFVERWRGRMLNIHPSLLPKYRGLRTHARALEAIRAGGVRALAHITGGGLTENLPRVLPEGLGARVDLGAWTPDPVFGWLAHAGGVAEAEMLRSFNCGIGLVLVCAPDRADALAELLAEAGERVARIGTVEAGQGVAYEGAAGW
jgi:phosphoribosylformylglycinamidine cyclo-ligase